MPAWTFLADCMIHLLTDVDVRVVGAWMLTQWFRDWVDQERELRGLPLVVNYPSVEIAHRALLFPPRDAYVLVVEPLDSSEFPGVRLQRPSEAAQRLVRESLCSDELSEQLLQQP